MCEMLSGILWTLCGAKFCHIKCQERGWCEATQSPQQHGKLRRRQKHCNSQEIQKNDMFHVVVSLLLVVLCALHPLANNSVSLSHFSPYFLHCDLFKILFQKMPTQSPKKQIKRHAMSPPEICLPFVTIPLRPCGIQGSFGTRWQVRWPPQKHHTSNTWLQGMFGNLTWHKNLGICFWQTLHCFMLLWSPGWLRNGLPKKCRRLKAVWNLVNRMPSFLRSLACVSGVGRT